MAISVAERVKVQSRRLTSLPVGAVLIVLLAVVGVGALVFAGVQMFGIFNG